MTANVSPPTQTPQGQPCLTGVGNNPSTICSASDKVAAQATSQNPGSRTQQRCAHNHNGQAKERNRGSKPLSKNVNLRSQSNNERPRPAKAIAWSEQGSTAPISTKYRKTAPQKCIAQSNVTQCRNRPLARSARRYKGVIGESKEGIGGTRNPPCPPWPPEAPKIKGLLNAELANENQTLEIIERWNQGEYKIASKER